MRHVGYEGSGPLYKQVVFKVFWPENSRRFTMFAVRAAKGRGFNDDNIEELLVRTAADVERLFPGQDYELVGLGPARFNFVWRARRDLQEPAAEATA